MAFNPSTDVGPVNPNGGGMNPVSMVLGGVGGLFNFFTAMKQIKAQKEMQANQIAANAALQNQEVAARESQLDPFRQQMMQGRDLSMLDMRQNYQPTQGYSPLQSGQTQRTDVRQPSYTPSPELLNWISMLKQNIAGGQNQAPTMTNPANYGKTSALDLLSFSQNPSGAAYARGANFAPATPTMMMSPGRRREEMV